MTVQLYYSIFDRGVQFGEGSSNGQKSLQNVWIIALKIAGGAARRCSKYAELTAANDTYFTFNYYTLGLYSNNGYSLYITLAMFNSVFEEILARSMFLGDDEFVGRWWDEIIKHDVIGWTRNIRTI